MKEEQKETEGKEERKEKLKERRMGGRDRLVNQIIKSIFTIIKVIETEHQEIEV